MTDSATAHASVDTDALMGIANELAGFAETPADSAIYYAGHGIRKVLIGVDISAGELLFARQYGFDAVIAHQPLGLVDAWQTFHAHARQLERAGVPHAKAEAAIAERLEALAILSQREHFDRLTSLARLLDVPLLNIKQALEEVGRRILQAGIDDVLQRSPHATLAAVAASIAALPELQAAPTQVQILMGDPAAPAGHTIVSHAAYTNGGYSVAAGYFRHGVDTVVYNQIDQAELVRLRADGQGHLLVTGQIATAAVGLNPYIRRLEELGLEVVRISGAIA